MITTKTYGSSFYPTLRFRMDMVHCNMFANRPSGPFFATNIASKWLRGVYSTLAVNIIVRHTKSTVQNLFRTSVNFANTISAFIGSSLMPRVAMFAPYIIMVCAPSPSNCHGGTSTYTAFSWGPAFDWDMFLYITMSPPTRIMGITPTMPFNIGSITGRNFTCFHNYIIPQNTIPCQEVTKLTKEWR